MWNGRRRQCVSFLGILIAATYLRFLDVRDHKISIQLLSGSIQLEQKEMSVLAPFYEFNLQPERRYQIKVSMLRRDNDAVFDSYEHTFWSGKYLICNITLCV